MARSNHDDFNGYRKWLGINNKTRHPTHYELLGISLDEDDPDVIHAAVEQRRRFVESKRGDGHDGVVTEILYRISEAETTLLNNEMRREYDRQRKLWEKRQKNRQIDPIATRSRVRSRPGPTVGEGTGFVSTFAGILGAFCVAIAIMTWFSFQLPWFEAADQAEAAPVVQVPDSVAAPAQVALVPAPVVVASNVLAQTAKRPDILIADFEMETYGNWKVEGEAFGAGPAVGTLADQMPVFGYQGMRLVNSYVKRDQTTGKLTSPEFTIQRSWINFLIGGGGHDGETCMNLLVGGKVVRTEVGRNTINYSGSEELQSASWDVADLVGKTAVLQIVDQHTGVWGHINIDQITLSDTNTAPIRIALKTADRSSQDQSLPPRDEKRVKLADSQTSSNNNKTQPPIPKPAEDPTSPYVGKYKLNVTYVQTRQRDPERILEFRADMTLITNDGLTGAWKLVGDQLQIEVAGYKIEQFKKTENELTGIAMKDGERYRFEATKISD